jgi:terminase small subunit-like protein
MPRPVAVPLPTSTAPAHLEAEEAALYLQVVRSYGLRDEVSLRILQEAMASLQRARRARETIDKDGMTVRDAKNQLKMHPLCSVERDARAAALAAFRQLNLELPRTLSSRSAC